jgi:hypothetical protein
VGMLERGAGGLIVYAMHAAYSQTGVNVDDTDTNG